MVTRDQWNGLIEVCILEAWPAWLARAAVSDEPTVRGALLAGARRRDLEAGLTAAAEGMRRTAPDGLAAGLDLSVMIAQLRTG